MADRTALLVRVGIDSSYGGWNAPVDPDSLEFAYVPIPEEDEQKPIRPGYQKSYYPFEKSCRRFEILFPERLLAKNAHLDPDFEHLTYGDTNQKGAQIRKLVEDDIIAFYASLKIPKSHLNRLLYAIIGLYVVEKVVSASDVNKEDWDKNAHTRRLFDDTDYVVFAKRDLSGRLKQCIPIGEWRNRAYRVRKDLLDIWGELSAHNGYIQRSARIPSIGNSLEFYKWFNRQEVPLVQTNY